MIVSIMAYYQNLGQSAIWCPSLSLEVFSSRPTIVSLQFRISCPKFWQPLLIASSAPISSITTSKRRQDSRKGALRRAISCRSLIESQLLQKQKVYACYVDLTKAFDKVPRAHLWRKLQNMGIDSNLRRTIQLLYDSCKVKVKLTNGYTKLTDSNAGLGQGGHLSPQLFSLVMQRLEELLSKARNCDPVLETPLLLHSLLFADDFVLLSTTAKVFAISYPSCTVFVSKHFLLSTSRNQQSLSMEEKNGNLCFTGGCCHSTKEGILLSGNNTIPIREVPQHYDTEAKKGNQISSCKSIGYPSPSLLSCHSSSQNLDSQSSPFSPLWSRKLGGWLYGRTMDKSRTSPQLLCSTCIKGPQINSHSPSPC